MTLTPTPAPDGALGIDADQVFTDAMLARAALASYKGRKVAVIGRYVGLGSNGMGDISAAELTRITEGHHFGCWLSQHAPNEGWTPSAQRGIAAGDAARVNALAAGYAEGAHLQYDLEGVAEGTKPEQVMEDVDAWGRRVRDYFAPILYVGWRSILSPEQLWELHAFHAYSCDWDTAREVANRGFCYRQFLGDTFFAGIRVDLGTAMVDTRGARLIFAAAEIVTEPSMRGPVLA